jgi:hypothetical protein
MLSMMMRGEEVIKEQSLSAGGEDGGEGRKGWIREAEQNEYLLKLTDYLRILLSTYASTGVGNPKGDALADSTGGS